MRYGFFGNDGRIMTAHNDDTVIDLPDNAIPLNDEQWITRFDLLLVDGELTDSPLIPIDEPADTRYTPLEFLERFTDAEQLGVVEATMGSAQVKLWYDKLLASTYVDVSDQRTIDGLAALVSANLITEVRQSEILGIS